MPVAEVLRAFVTPQQLLCRVKVWLIHVKLIKILSPGTSIRGFEKSPDLVSSRQRDLHDSGKVV